MQSMTLLGSSKRLIKRSLWPVRVRTLRRAEAAGFPQELVPAFRYIATDQMPAGVQQVRDNVERRRQQMVDDRDAYVVFPYDPEPGSAGDVSSPDLKPQPGKEMRMPVPHAATVMSVEERWGVFLHLCAASAKAGTILELGCAAGIASSYMTQSPHCRRFIGIDASADMLDLTRASIEAGGGSARVDLVHGLFDDGLDTVLAEPDLSIDLAWIDGHHEKIATFHYLERIIPKLAPGAIVLYDDIRWSQDMYECWEALRKWPGFEHTVDAGKLGLGVWSGGEKTPRAWDMTGICPPKAIGNPWGWRN